MKKDDRNKEKIRETLRYKQSKKRCNLYVKNFPANWDEDKLKEYFERYGETERGGIKIQKTNTNNVFAFVCFKSPDSAASAKQHLHNQTVDGKTLIINHYEIKEFRDLAKEEAMDKQNYEQYMAQKTGGFHLNDLVTHPHMTQILQQLLEIMQNSDQMHHPFQQDHRMRGGAGRASMHRGGNFNNRGGQHNNYQNRGGHQQQMGGNMNQGMP
jgi:RNA recognition motif-containing protein